MCNYDEAQELFRYVSRNKLELMTPLERNAENFGYLREKARLSSDPVYSALLAKFSAEAKEEAMQLIGDEMDGFRRFQARVAERIDRDIASGRAFVNRCPSCNRIVKTPLACQCLWCGHDWHNR